MSVCNIQKTVVSAKIYSVKRNQYWKENQLVFGSVPAQVVFHFSTLSMCSSAVSHKLWWFLKHKISLVVVVEDIEIIKVVGEMDRAIVTETEKENEKDTERYAVK